EAVQQSAFVEHGRLRGVEVLRLRITQSASAEANGVAFAIPNREHKAISETIVEASVVARAGEPCLSHLCRLIVPGRHEVEQRIPAIRGKPQLPCLHRLLRHMSVSDQLPT